MEQPEPPAEERDAAQQLLPPATESTAEDKGKRSSAKSIWILTYGASGPYITAPMLNELGKIKADECHSTMDRVMKSTYIHLMERVRQSSIEKFMEKANKKHGIVKNEIFGYDSIASRSREKNDHPIEEHAGFQMLVRHFNSKNPAFQPWTDGEPVLKRGRILKEAEIDYSRPETLTGKTRAQLIAHTVSLGQRVKVLDEKGDQLLALYTDVSNERSTLRSENAMLKRKIQELEDTRV
jgi:hypothetical protein